MARRDDEYRPRRQKQSNAGNSERPRKKQKGGMSPLAIVGLVFAGLFGFCVICGGLFMVIGLPRARTAARMSTSKNNLKHIGLALHNYHDTHRVFPPGGVFDEENNINRHSWMTMILPFMDQSPLYNQIESNDGFHIAWNDPQHESTGSFRRVIPAFLNQEIKQKMVDGYGAAHYAGNSQLFFRNSSIRIRDITDGTTNTIMGGEVSSGFMAWGNPENIRDPSKGLGGSPDGFGSPFKKNGKGGAQMLFADGSVKFISSDIDPETLKRLSLPADGKVVPEY